MADNGYVEGAKNGSDFFLPVNPYASAGNAIQMKGFKIDDKRYWASVQYVVAAGGATTTITPLTGNTSGDLDFYRVEISDGVNTAVGSLSLSARTTPFVIDTSDLVPTNPWTLYFFGAETSAFGDAPEPLRYKKELPANVGVSGVTGNTIPTDWVNVQLKLKLTSTNDTDFDLFPADGLIINQGDTVALLDYTTNAELVNNGAYVFSLEAKKIGSQPVAAAMTSSNTDVIESKSAAVTFPYALTQEWTPIYTALTIETDAAGADSSLQTITLTGEGVVASFTFTMTATTAA